MNPWQSLRAEIHGAMRSIRYDVQLRRARRARRQMNSETVVLPTVKARKGRRRTVFTAGAVLLPVAGFSGYMALTSGLGALIAEAGTPVGLPDIAVAASPTSDLTAPPPTEPLLPARDSRPAPTQPEPAPSISISISPPVPTPAPSVSCTPTPSPTASPTASPTPSNPPAPTFTPSPSSIPTP